MTGNVDVTLKTIEQNLIVGLRIDKSEAAVTKIIKEYNTRY